MGKPFRRPAARPASSFKFQPTKVSRLAEAKQCAAMNPGINPKSFEQSYGLKLSDVLTILAGEKADRERGMLGHAERDRLL